MIQPEKRLDVAWASAPRSKDCGQSSRIQVNRLESYGHDSKQNFTIAHLNITVKERSGAKRQRKGNKGGYGRQGGCDGT